MDEGKCIKHWRTFSTTNLARSASCWAITQKQTKLIFPACKQTQSSPLTNLLHFNSLSEFSPKAEMSLEKEQKTKEKDQFVDKSEVAYKYKFPIYSATQKIVLVNHTYYE